MSNLGGTLWGFGAALCAGLLIGVERERRKGTGPHRALAGVRTFALTAVAGFVAAALDQPWVMVVGALLIACLALIAYGRNRSDDPGITTEVALFVTYLLGLLALSHAGFTAAAAVVVAILLAGRTSLHQFSVEILSDSELRDGLMFAAAALILLPVLPDQLLPWTIGINPRRLWGLVVLFMATQGAAYVALRIVGSQRALAMAGLASGFVSSTGTIASLGAKARQRPVLLAGCVAGALSSTVATIVLLAAVTLTVHPPAFISMASSLGCALVAAVITASVALLKENHKMSLEAQSGRAFNLWQALAFALALSGATAAVSLINTYWGGAAAAAATALSALVDVHAAATSALSLAAGGRLSLVDLRISILIALSANTLTKVVAAFASGGRAYGSRVTLGILCTVTAAWLPLALG